MVFTLKEVQYKDIINIEKLHIPGRKITCIVGQSGSGKSTLLRLLNHLISYDHGTIIYKNVSLQQIDPIQLRREVIMASQVPTIFAGTVKDNLLIGLKFSEKPFVDDPKLKAVLELVCLNKSLTDNAEQLSGGEKQRLALARVLLLNPEVYLLDEPTSALDSETETKVMGNFIREVQNKQKTLIIVTHSNKLAETCADTIIELKNGRIIDVKEF